MSLRGRLLVFGYPLLEVVTAYLVALWIGWGWMLLLLLIGFPIGFAIMRNAGDRALANAQVAAAGGEVADPGRPALTFIGGVLVFIPGFWSDLLGLLLAFPPTQRLFRRRGTAWAETRFATVRMPGVRSPYATGDVIPGTVVQREDPPGPTPPGDPREIGY